MSDWQIGDLAVCVEAPGFLRHPSVVIGATFRVIEVECSGGVPGLVLNGAPSRHPSRAHQARRFVKIKDDEQEACEPEFITLLKRSKVPETASDWLLSVKDLARRLNEQSRRDPREREAGNRLPANQ